MAESMKVRAHWDDDAHRVIIQQFDSGWTWEDHSDAVEETHRLMASVPHIVDVIANMGDASLLPADPFSYTKRAMRSAPENSGTTVIVTTRGGAFIRALLGVFQKIYRDLAMKLVVVDSLEEAREAIREEQAKRAEQP